jgi:hypothetical protein
MEGWDRLNAAQKARNPNLGERQKGLSLTAQLSGWPTPGIQVSANGSACAMTPTDVMDSAASTVLEDHQDITGPMMMAGWPTPTKGKADGSQIGRDASATGRRPDGSKATVSLNQVATLAGWGTPTVQDAKHATLSTSEQTRDPNNLRSQVFKAGLATPAHRDYRYPNATTYAERGGGAKGEQLPNQVAHLLAGWATPRQSDGEKNVRSPEGARREIERKGAQNDLGLVSGLMLSGSPASTASRGALNPAFSRWLQGYPKAWDDCAPSKIKL